MKKPASKKIQDIEIQGKTPEAPSKEEVEFSKTLEGKILKYIETSAKGKHFLEGYMFSWSMVEKILLPKLISFVSKNLEVSMPDSLWKLGQVSINHVYLSISHDKILFAKLERGRKIRNRLIHELVEKNKIETAQEEAKEALRFNLQEVIKPIFERLDGTYQIPSLTLYSSGWNDALDVVLKKLKA